MKKPLKLIASLIIISIFGLIVKNVFFTSSNEKFLQKGLEQYEKGNYASAATNFYHVDKEKNPEALILLASCNLNLNEYESAASHFQEAYDKNLGNPEEKLKIMHNLGLSYLKLGKYNQAEIYLNKAKDLGHPNSGKVLEILHQIKLSEEKIK